MIKNLCNLCQNFMPNVLTSKSHFVLFCVSFHFGLNFIMSQFFKNLFLNSNSSAKLKLYFNIFLNYLYFQLILSYDMILISRVHQGTSRQGG